MLLVMELGVREFNTRPREEGRRGQNERVPQTKEPGTRAELNQWGKQRWEESK